MIQDILTPTPAPVNYKCLSLVKNDARIDTTSKLIHQTPIEIHEHHVKLGYQILSKNDFTRVKSRVNFGIFNKKTNFMIGEKNSIMVFDKIDKKIKTQDTSSIIKNKKQYYFIYDTEALSSNIKRIKITSKSGEDVPPAVLELTFNFGKAIGEFIKNVDPKKFKDETSSRAGNQEDIWFMSSLIDIDVPCGKININKNILLNSNNDFLLGILSGFMGEDDRLQIDASKNINIYNFVYILNILCAQYSIVRDDFTGITEIKFRLLPKFKDVALGFGLKLRKKFFMNPTDRYIPEADTHADTEDNLISMIRSGRIELLPCADFAFVEVLDKTMWDLTMPNINAQNYFFGGSPLLKNSDGDVLAVIGMHTKDAALECSKKFGTENKQKFLNLSDGKVQNWGIKLDAALGLYNATL